MFGLYVHIPFCNAICSYCDFYKMKVSPSFQKKVIDALIKEFGHYRNIKQKIDTVYIGGGTPSCLSNELLDTLLTRLDSFVEEINGRDALKEYTFEMNPEDISHNKLTLLKKHHISRISVGAQSFDERIHKVIGRVTEYHDFKNKIDMIKEHGFNNINIDFMYGILPEAYYGINDLEEDLNKIISCGPNHISCYSLILEEKTILGEKAKNGLYQRPTEEFEALCYEKIRDNLSINGFFQYETSNFARKGFESLHNLIYWNNDEYIGIGPSSAGYINGIRYKVVSNINTYLKEISDGIIPMEKEVLSESDKMEYEIILGLRKVNGISEKTFFNKFHKNLLEVYPKITEMIEKGYLVKRNDNIFLKAEYYYVQNYIISEII